MCDGGNTPGFRQHAGRESPWAFPGARQYYSELTNDSHSEGHFETPDQWLERLGTDIIIAFFGYNESFRGPEGVDHFKNELRDFIAYTGEQAYNGTSTPELILITPIAAEEHRGTIDLPDHNALNEQISLYSEALIEVAQETGTAYVDIFQISMEWFDGAENLTIDGIQLNDQGNYILGEFLAEKLLGSPLIRSGSKRNEVLQAVIEKNWFWHNDFKIPNGVHVFGRRYNPFGPDNYPAELDKIREMTFIRDMAIWSALGGDAIDLDVADGLTSSLPPVKSNFEPGDYGRGTGSYLYDQEAMDSLVVAEGYELSLFASESEFPDLANPVQLSFDNEGRLWVATMPTYPHWKPGDPKPNDKLIILEDTDGDGTADKQTTYADMLHLPVGFEIAPEGVYISQGTNLKLYTDTDGDDKADKIEIIFSGFDDHDTHHNISAFCADPSGALYMGEGVFLHTTVETPYGPVRASNGGFYRFNPARRHLERTAQLAIPNPWGIAFDRWGQNFFLETSGPALRWMMPGSVKPRYGNSTHKSFDLVEDEHKVRPTSGLEFVSSRHFPDEVQGDIIFGNAIGFLGIKQHRVLEDSTGFALSYRQDLLQSKDLNFRPVDLEFAPDGSLYVVDWHNVLVGHMQHNARDPYRDHVHGRIYRITYPSRPLVEPAHISGASIQQLLENMKLPEYRTRYRTRRELRGRDQSEVLPALEQWLSALDTNDPSYEHHRLEGLWVTWGMNQVSEDLLVDILQSRDHRARAAAVRVLRYTHHQIEDPLELFLQAASDEHGRVRLEAIVAASWLDQDDGLQILEKASELPLDRWMIHAHETAVAHLKGRNLMEAEEVLAKTDLKGVHAERFQAGLEIYEREGHCGICHQRNGKGLPSSGFPPLAGTDWVNGDKDRLIKLTLNGLYGPITVNEQTYPGQVPMTPFGGLLDDEEIASVLTYVRNAFGNQGDPISPDEVQKVRMATQDKQGFYTPEELMD
jgi:mono/diheme cytochrome c family protein/glucose/arabinose dehydrogenase